jgi:hypothetical protein
MEVKQQQYPAIRDLHHFTYEKGFTKEKSG